MKPKRKSAGYIAVSLWNIYDPGALHTATAPLNSEKPENRRRFSPRDLPD